MEEFKIGLEEHAQYLGNGSPAEECSTVIRTAGVGAQLTAVSCGLRQATLSTCATWSGSEGYCMVY